MLCNWGKFNNIRISPFSVMLAVAVLTVAGIFSLRRLTVQYKPASGGRTITVSYRMPGASAETVETECTTLLEGVLSSISGCCGTSSTSRKGSGNVKVTFDKGTDMAAARFKVASALRNVRSSLPEGMDYPAISLDVGGNRNSVSLSFLLKGSLPSRELGRFARNRILPELSVMDGVDRVALSGITPYRWVITFDADRASSLGVVADDISSAVSDFFGERMLGMAHSPDGSLSAVRLELGGEGSGMFDSWMASTIGSGISASHPAPDFGSIPVKCSGGKIVHLSDIASWQYEESLPETYYRINGLNTITISVSLASDANLITVTSAVKDRMASLQESFPPEITVSVGYDSSEYVRDELRRIFIRTILCLLILLVFVFIVNRSWRSTLVVTLTLAVNILISLAFYALLKIPVHIYTMAGITVSLGIVIDTTIVMSDHYARCHDRGAFPDIVSAVLTTVAALMTVLLLPASERGNLTDFIAVISLNLCISLAVAFFFIPALMHYLPAKSSASVRTSRRRARLAFGWRRFYSGYIRIGVRFRWLFALVLIGLAAYPSIMFYKSLDRADFYRETAKKTLYIRAGMPEGCSVQQLNEVVKSMENYLSQFDEISVFTTRIDAHDDATISVEFRPEYENTVFPSVLKGNVTRMAINSGGANWSISGIDENYFNNNIVSDFKSCRIKLYGYNYRELLGYAERLVDHLSSNRRVSGPEIWSSDWSRPSTEFVLDYDFSSLAMAGVDPYAYYGSLSSLLYDSRIASIQTGGEMAEVVLRSSDADSFDLWHVLNVPVGADSVKVALSNVGSIVKKKGGLDIKKKNQSYELSVCYDFIGGVELSKRVAEEAVSYMNASVLPVGFRAENGFSGWFDEHKDRYAWLILLIVAVMYVMLAISFESLLKPLAVIAMIPVSFVGLFMVFGFSSLSFDQGGFAALVMLCGVVVNAGIYLVNEWGRQGHVSGCGSAAGGRDVPALKAYLRAYGRKIGPIMLTVISTVLGLLPFLSDGPQEVFWFDFAAGTIGGMAFSVFAVVFVLPLFLFRRKDVR